MSAVPMVELWRGGLLESTHSGHAVICNAAGEVIESWGDPGVVIFPRSSCKMIQALPLVESGAADAVGLTTRHLAFACASHLGAGIHRAMAADWLGGLGMGDADLRCGVQEPDDRTERNRLIAEGEAPCQLHNNCSGKHSGFLTLNRHLRGGTEYVEHDHPVQQAAKAAYEETTAETSAGWGIDGCSAPNFASTLTGFARALGAFAGATEGGDTRQKAMVRLRQAMTLHPELVSGEGGACTELMRAMGGRVTLKGGAEGVYAAILPDQGLGIALKIVDGSERAKEAAIAALLVRAGVLDAEHPATRRRLNAVQLNRRGIETGVVTTAVSFP